ncbi:Uncharacterised protein [Campylobacter upsaliensis]|nr:Uncharacterised protein [Campylobacter upsaliensis]
MPTMNLRESNLQNISFSFVKSYILALQSLY